MFQWIVDNKQWLFSGVGVMLLLLIGNFLRRRFTRPRTTDMGLGGHSLSFVIQGPSTPPIALPTTVADIAPDDILKSVEAAPLLQRPDVAHHYRGLRVSWDGSLANARKKSDRSVRLQISCGKESSASVFVDVNPTDYPGIGLLRERDSLVVSGIVADVSSYIDLVEAHVDFKVTDHPDGKP